jgi:hypothetical protein
MRPPLLAMLLLAAGCGSVRLGQEPADPESDAETDIDAVGVSDAKVAELRVVVTVRVPEADCDPCLDVTAEGALGTPPYTFEWEDGEKVATRHLCAPLAPGALTVTARDAAGRSSSPHVLRLDLPAEACVDAGARAQVDASAAAAAPLLCLQNPSFEGTPAINTGGAFMAPPWSDCTNPSRYNTPEIASMAGAQLLIPFPAPTDGQTYLRLREGTQASQALCAPIRAGEKRSFRIDAQKLDLHNVSFGDSELAFLSIWGAQSASCTVDEQLWISPKLSVAWQTFCVTLTPREDMDQLTLKAVSDETAATSTYLFADHIVPVASCP